jgi:hypothetical protein
VNAIWLTKTGISGTFSMSFGMPLNTVACTFACENGSVMVISGKVTVRQGEQDEGKTTVKEFKNEGFGVKQEVAAWAGSLVQGKNDPRQTPEQALADLEILEKMLKSGERHGKPESLQFQI